MSACGRRGRVERRGALGELPAPHTQRRRCEHKAQNQKSHCEHKSWLPVGANGVADRGPLFKVTA